MQGLSNPLDETVAGHGGCIYLSVVAHNGKECRYHLVIVSLKLNRFINHTLSSCELLALNPFTKCQSSKVYQQHGVSGGISLKS